MISQTYVVDAIRTPYRRHGGARPRSVPMTSLRSRLHRTQSTQSLRTTRGGSTVFLRLQKMNRSDENHRLR